MEPPAWVDLEEGETVVRADEPRLRRAASTLVTAVLWAVTASALAYGFADVLPAYVDDPYPFSTTYFWYVVAGVIGAWVLAVLLAVLRLTTTQYVLTNRALYAKRGVLSTTVSRVDVDRVRNTTVHRSILGNLLQYGSVEIYTTDGEIADTTLAGLGSPAAVQSAIGELVGEGAQGISGGGTEAGQAGTDADVR